MNIYDYYQDYHDTAYSILKEIEAIKECDIHDDWYHTTGIDESFVYVSSANKLKGRRKTQTSSCLIQ